MSQPSIRKCYNFVSPPEWDKEKTQGYRIGFSYYREGKWTGKSEDVVLSEETLYRILKPYLKVTEEERR